MMGQSLIGKKVIVRDHMAGTHFGTLVALDVAAGTVELSGALKLWRWQTEQGPSVHDLAVHGVRKRDCKISARVELVCMRALVEVVPCTEVAARRIEE